MKKIIIALTLSMLALGLFGCGTSEGGNGEDLKTMKEHEIISVKTPDEYKEFYNGYIPKLKSIIESDGKLYLNTTLDGFMSVEQTENHYNNAGQVMLIDFTEYEGSVTFNLSSYSSEGYPVEEQNKKVIEIIKELFGYNIDIKKLNKHLETSSIYEISEIATIFKGDSGELSFDAKILENTSGIEAKDCIPKATKEEVKEYNTLKNGEIDKIVSRYDKSKSSVKAFMNEENDNSFNVELGSAINDFTLRYTFVVVDDERFNVNNEIDINKNEDDYKSNEEHLDTELKGLFEDLYGDTKLYEEVKSKLLAMSPENEDVAIIFTPDDLGLTKVTLKNRKYHYGIEIIHDFPME